MMFACLWCVFAAYVLSTIADTYDHASHAGRTESATVDLTHEGTGRSFYVYFHLSNAYARIHTTDDRWRTLDDRVRRKSVYKQRDTSGVSAQVVALIGYLSFSRLRLPTRLRKTMMLINEILDSCFPSLLMRQSFSTHQPES